MTFLHNILEVYIMHYNVDVTTDLELNSLTDLPKLKILMENLNMKINKSMLAREMGVDRRTIDRYLKGNIPKVTRERSSKIDDYYPTISLLLSKESRDFLQKNF
jgi:hypothetical protein